MKRDLECKPVIIYPDKEARPDDLSIGHLTMIVPAQVPKGDRSKEELAAQLKEERDVKDVRDMCRRLGVEIEADVRDPEGNEIHLRVPVVDEETFTLDGMTRQDPTLFRWHVWGQTYESVQRYLKQSGVERLSDEQIARLTMLASYLEEAEKRHDH